MRVPVELRHAYRLLNHGPTTLITSAAGGRSNVMAAQWVMALDFNPPKLAAVLAGDAFTRELVDASGELCVNLPTVDAVDLVWAVGSVSGRELDKFTRYGIATTPASLVGAPLVEGCAAWLECRVVPEPEVQRRYNLFVLEVVAAWADDALFADGEWRATGPRTIHHVTRGAFFTTGTRVDAKRD